MKNSHELEGLDLLDALGVEQQQPDTGGYTPRQERILAGFEDILRFRETHGHAPRHGQSLDIFERLYAVRLDQLRKMTEADLAILRPLDHSHLLEAPQQDTEPLTDDDLLAALSETATDDIGTLVHVQSLEAKRESPDYIAERVKCEDFDLYKPLFGAAEADLAAGRRTAKRFIRDAGIEAGDFFILGGQMVFVAHVGKPLKAPNGESDARLRVVYSNETESNILRRSLQRALYKDKQGRRVTQDSLGPLFGDTLEPGDIETGTIYILRSLSTQPEIAAIRDSLHKIGVTGGSVGDRIANAKLDPTFLMAPVDVVATWKLSGIRRFKLEQTFHRLFAVAQLQISIPDKFGNKVQPQEWFLVPLPVIKEAVGRICDGSIPGFVYDPVEARLKPA